MLYVIGASIVILMTIFELIVLVLMTIGLGKERKRNNNGQHTY